MSTIRPEITRKIQEYKRVVELDEHEQAKLATFSPEEQLGTLAIMHRIDQRMSKRAAVRPSIH